MSYYDDIYEVAVDHHYLISTDDAARIGVPSVELAKLAYRGKLENISHGLYRLARYVPSNIDPYAVAVARMGDGAYLYGESVIAMLELAPTNPAYICVAIPRRTRRKVPRSIRVKKASTADTVTEYEGVPSQSVACAIASAKDTMMDDRLRAAARRAREEGYLIGREYDDLRESMGWR